MSMLSRIVVAAMVALIPLMPLFAGGSFYLEDIRDLLHQQPGLWAHFRSAYDISPTGDARRIGTGQNPKLSGIRVAPYLPWAKPKGVEGDFTLMLEIEAETTYVDAHGKSVPLKKATNVKERLKGILVRELKPDEKKR